MYMCASSIKEILLFIDVLFESEVEIFKFHHLSVLPGKKIASN